MKIMTICLFLGILSLPLLALEQTPCVIIQSSLVLKVANPTATAKQIIDKLESFGGYFSVQTRENLVLKVPARHIQTMIAFCIEQGMVVDRNFEAKDIGLELENMKARLQSQSDVLEKFLFVMQSANSDGIVSVETQITKLLEEIDTLKGALKMLEHRLTYAELKIDFQFRERKSPVPTGVSSFPWLNTMNMEDVLKEFKHD